MRFLSSFAFAGVTACLVLSGIPAHAADTAAIQGKLQLCESCHSKDGISVLPEIPSIAGQPDQYLQWQLVFFRAGTRKSDQMSPVAADLSNEDIRNLAGYFAGLRAPATPPADDNPALSQAGAKIAAQNRCASCHTDTFAGTKAVAGSPASARTTCSRPSRTTRAVCVRAAAWRPWPRSPIR